MSPLLTDNPHDLTDEELSRWLLSVPVSRYDPADMQRMAREIQRHRALQHMTTQRTQEIIAAEVRRGIYEALHIHDACDINTIANTVAERAADQLARVREPSR